MESKIISRIAMGQRDEAVADRDADNRFVALWMATFEAARAKRG